MKRVTIKINIDQEEKRKELKRKTGLKLDSIDGFAYEKGLEEAERIFNGVDIFEAMSDAFRPPKS